MRVHNQQNPLRECKSKEISKVSEIMHWKEKKKEQRSHRNKRIDKYVIANMIKSPKTTDRYHCFHIKIISL